MIHHEPKPSNQNVDKAVLNRIVKHVLCERPNTDNSRWLPQHENSRLHCSLDLNQFLIKYVIVEFNHRTFSPEMSPPNFYVFLKLKTAMKEHQFTDVEDIQKNVTHPLRRKSSEE